MTKIGRNDPCPCGGGKKYKKCCLEKDEAAAAASRAAALPAPTVSTPTQWEDDPLDDDSNHVVDLIHAGDLDAAEAAAHELMRKYPDVPDGLMRLAMVFEKRGDSKKAADYYRQTAAFMDQHEGFEDDYKADLRAQADELDPPHERVS